MNKLKVKMKQTDLRALDDFLKHLLPQLVDSNFPETRCVCAVLTAWQLKVVRAKLDWLEPKKKIPISMDASVAYALISLYEQSAIDETTHVGNMLRTISDNANQKFR